MHNPPEHGKPCQIVVDDLFTMINKRRKMLHLEPVENRAMASRCTLRFNLSQQRGVDFNSKKISVAAADMQTLRDMVNDQFGVDFENELNSLCAKAQTETVPRMVTTHTHLPEPEPDVFAHKQQTGFGSRLKRLFGGR